MTDITLSAGPAPVLTYNNTGTKSMAMQSITSTTAKTHKKAANALVKSGKA